MLWTFYVDAGGGVGQQGRWRGGDRDEKGRQGRREKNLPANPHITINTATHAWTHTHTQSLYSSDLGRMEGDLI